ncbi:MAG: MaoC family dehydratase N-terminal domain-containing protein [Actinomycetota bacterium]|nr:MaoC family dehydratase N-terminal domain-containing protein [Actinomycetota bacterium]
MSERRIDTGNVFPTRATLEGITPGMDLEETVFGPVSRDDIVRYAEASGDDNPIHQDEDYARKSGAPTVFAMGMLPAGYLATALSGWFGGPHHIRRYKVRFTTRVWPGDEVVCSGRITAIEGGLVKVTVEARRRGASPEGLDLPEEETAIVGEADIELPES